MSELDDRHRRLDNGIFIDVGDVHWEAVRAAGPGGQNVNKVNSAIHLRYDLKQVSLPEEMKQRLLATGDRRISADGVIVIKAQRFRTQGQNRADALERLLGLLNNATKAPKRRLRTRPTRASVERRHKKKGITSKNKALRRKPGIDS